MCSRLKRLLWCPKDDTRVQNDKTGEENRTTEGWERRARWCCYSFVRKASAFSPKIIFLSATLDCLSTTSCL